MKLLGKAHDKAFWEEVRTKDVYKSYRDMLAVQWEKGKDYQPEALPYSKFKLFFTTGDRSQYEGPYFKRRHNLEISSILSLIYPEEQVYLDYAMDFIYAICDEYTWCLPAHQGKLEPNNNSRIDLFASETAYRLSEIFVLLEDRLEPLIKNRIIYEINRRVIDPFIATEHYGWWEKGNMNWTAVCMGSVANTVMLMRPELATDEFIARANASMDTFLGGFEDDGMCLEGLGYWGYGFGFFMLYADMVRTFTEGRVDYFKSEKVKTVATFNQKMVLTGDCSISFADGGAKYSYDIGRMHYLKNEYPDDVLVYDTKYAGSSQGKFCSLLRRILWMDEKYLTEFADDTVEREYYAPNSQWFIKRNASYGFAAKGGHNSEPHNHNDVGNFIFAKNGRQLICDLGSGKYTRQYFAGGTRYTFIETRSGGHSLPIIDGAEQCIGSIARAVDASCENGVFSIDIAQAYRYEGLNSLKRTFTCTDDTVTLTDNIGYNGRGEIIERLVTRIEPKVLDGGIVEIADATVTYDAEKCSCTVEAVQTSRDATVYLINFNLNEGVKTFTCTIK